MHRTPAVLTATAILTVALSACSGTDRSGGTELDHLTDTGNTATERGPGPGFLRDNAHRNGWDGPGWLTADGRDTGRPQGTEGDSAQGNGDRGDGWHDSGAPGAREQREDRRLQLDPDRRGVTAPPVRLSPPPGTRLGANSTAQLGTIVADGLDFTLYRFDNDSAHPSRSTCVEECATTWPPLIVEDPLTFEGFDEEQVGQVMRSDGRRQVTIGGWPVYTFVGDESPGELNGQGVNDLWFAIDPEGEKAGLPQCRGTTAAGQEMCGTASRLQ